MSGSGKAATLAVPTRRLGFQKSVVGNKTRSLHSRRIHASSISASSAIPVWTRRKKKRERERERKKENWRQRSIINEWNGRAKEGILASNPVAGHVTSEAGIRGGIIFERGSRSFFRWIARDWLAIDDDDDPLLSYPLRARR